MSLNTEEYLAIAVLKGDMAAALALVDLLQERYDGGAVKMVPVRQITCTTDRVRAAFIIEQWADPIAQKEVDRVLNAYTLWLHNGVPIVLQGMKMELYELPEEN